MVNKLTIESTWKNNPDKIYYVIQNPRIDSKSKKIVGLSIKSVEYKVIGWDKDYVTFEKINSDDNKRFPESILFDKRYPDAENEVYTERVSKAKVKPKAVDSYGIFIDKKMARFNKLIRLHRLCEDVAGIYKALKGQQEKIDINATDSEKVKDAKKGIDADKISFSLEDTKYYFNTIQETNYFDELESLQAEFPDLAVK